MSIQINVGNVPGNQGPQPSQTELNNFKNEIKDKSPQELGEMLKDPSLEPWKVQEIAKAMAEKLKEQQQDENDIDGPQGAGGAGGAGGSDDKRLEELMKKLANGTISEAELEELKGLMGKMGIPPEAVEQILQAQGAGKGQTPTPGNNDV